MRTLSFAIALSAITVAMALAAGTASAQSGKPAAAAAPAASMPMDCGAGMKRHDHGAERNAPSGKHMPCAPDDAASGTKAKAKAKPVHDHGRVHKNQ